MTFYTFLKFASATVFGLMGGLTVCFFTKKLIEKLLIDNYEFAVLDIILLICGIALVASAFLIMNPQAVWIRSACILSLLSSIVLFLILFILLSYGVGYAPDLAYLFLLLILPFSGFVLSILSLIFLPSHC